MKASSLIFMTWTDPGKGALIRFIGSIRVREFRVSDNYYKIKNFRVKAT